MMHWDPSISLGALLGAFVTTSIFLVTQVRMHIANVERMARFEARIDTKIETLWDVYVQDRKQRP